MLISFDSLSESFDATFSKVFVVILQTFDRILKQ